MKTCKECFHQKACMAMLEATVGYKLPDDHDGCADRCEDFIATVDVVEVVRCKDCKYHHHREQEPEHGKTMHLCSVLNSEVFKDFYCYHGTPKERGADELKKKYTEPTATEK